MKKNRILPIIISLIILLLFCVISFVFISIQRSPDELMKKNYNELASIPEEALNRVDQLADYLYQLDEINRKYETILNPTGEEAYYALELSAIKSDDILYKKYEEYRDTGIFEVYQRIADASKVTPLDDNLTGSAPERVMNAFRVSTVFLLRYALLYAYQCAIEGDYEGTLKTLHSYLIIAKIFRVPGMIQYANRAIKQIEEHVTDDIKIKLNDLK